MNTATFYRLVHIFPLDLAHLIPEILSILATETGVEQASNIYTELHLVQASEQLANINWTTIAADLQKYTQQNPTAFTTLMERIQLIADRAVLHPCLYKSKSIMTCKLQSQYRLPGPTPREAIPLRTEWTHHEKQADGALARGRACLAHFERIASDSGTPYTQLRVLIDEAADYYKRYQDHKKIYDEQFGMLTWYIEQSRSSQPPASPRLAEKSVA
jgi:hypothetical protein